MKVMSVVGGRAQFVKAAGLCRALSPCHESVLVHAGERYDYSMSDTFFSALGIAAPAFNLAVGGERSGRRTGEMLGMLEELIAEQDPDVVVVYGDSDTTLAAGLAAAKLGVPVAHVDAGQRSGAVGKPGSLNAVLVDHLSDVLFCTTRAEVGKLGGEGINNGVELVGDITLDTARFFAETVESGASLDRYELVRDGFYLATTKARGTSDSTFRLTSVAKALMQLDLPVLWAVDAKTTENIEAFGIGELLAENAGVTCVGVLDYPEANALLRAARAVLTDSPAMQKEAYFLGVPCITLAEQTEWIDTVETGWNRLAGTRTDEIVSAVECVTHPAARPTVYGDGHAAEAIVAALQARYASRT